MTYDFYVENWSQIFKMAEPVQEPTQNCKAPADHLLNVVDLGPPQQPQKKVS